MSSSGFLTRAKRMCTRFPIRDMSYLTAVFFWIGAAFFAVNGFFYVLMTTQPQTDFDTEATIAIPTTSCLGDFFFFLGCVCSVFEALNVGRGDILEAENSIGGVERTTEQPKEPWPIETAVPDEKETSRNDLEKANPGTATTAKIALVGSPEFIWFPSAKQLQEHYIRDRAFLAGISWMVGIVFFSIATIAYIPGVADLTVVNTYYYLALLPTFLGGFFFLIGAVLYMTISQRKWYLPALNRLTWHAGFWNAVGSIGFALGGALWYGGELLYWAATLASFWGAWGWFIGSTITWYIIMDNYP